MPTKSMFALLSFALAAATSAASAQQPAAAPTPARSPAAQDSQAKQPDSLVLYFASGRATIRPEDEALLDKAARLYRDGQPIVMVVSGATDNVGPATQNLQLSALRANAVVHGLESRGIPAEHLQLVAKGESEPAVQTDAADGRNRRVEITWR